MKNWVLRWNLKDCFNSEVWISSGELFQSPGAATAKARSSLRFNRDFGYTKSIWLDDLSAPLRLYMLRCLLKQLSPIPFKTLKVKSKIIWKSNGQGASANLLKLEWCDHSSWHLLKDMLQHFGLTASDGEMNVQDPNKENCSSRV